MKMPADEVHQIRKTENMSSQNPGPESEKPARCKRIDKRGDPKKVREIMSLKIEKNSCRGNQTEFGDGRSFIAWRRSSPILGFDLKKSG
jgi:hypothetical protein